MPMPHSRPGSPASVPEQLLEQRLDAAEAALRPGLDARPARRGGRGSGRRGVVTATSMLVAPRSATRTCPASARKVSWRGGRPPVLGPTSPSTTSPRSISSPTRWATIARPRPVRATSSERDRDRPRRTSSRTTTSASSDSSGSGPNASRRGASTAGEPAADRRHDVLRHAAIIRRRATFALDMTK